MFIFKIIKNISRFLIFINILLSLFIPIFAQKATSVPKDEMQMYMTGELDIQNSGKPMIGVNVIAFDQVIKTNDKGIAYFENVMNGKQVVKVDDSGKEYDETIFVDSPKTTVDIASVTPSPQPKAVAKVSKSQSFPFSSIIIGISILLIVICSLIILFKSNLSLLKHRILKNRKYKFFFIGISAFLILSICVQSFSIVKNGSFLKNSKAAVTTLPVPSNIVVTQDDRSAVFEWNNKQRTSYFPDTASLFSSNNYGYVVFWGHDDGTGNILETPPLKKLTYDPAIQIQPLVDGEKYVAEIATVDFDGNISDLSSPIKFQSDPSRVNTLRTQMNGFFDDFNQSTGTFDETKWNNAYSGCVGANLGGQFINTQFHAHNQIFDSNCDRGVNVSRPRAVFDYTNRTGTITFDMDGTSRRDKWYLDLNPDTYGPVDIEGHVSLDANDPDHTGAGNSTPSSPINTLRITGTDKTVGFSTFDSQGWQYAVDGPKGASTGGNGTLCGDQANGSLNYCGSPVGTIKNVRRHWKITVSQSKVEAFINDIPVAQTDPSFTLPFSKATLDWVLFSYNTPKSNESTSLLHWDNFGFDAPLGYTQTTVTHNYIDGNVGTANFKDYDSTHPYTADVKIPDSISGATTARLMFTTVMQGYANYGWSASDNVKINGHSYALPNTSAIPQNVGILPSGILPQTVVININPSDLVQGDNNIVITPTSSGILNNHIELDFNKGSEPSYTQPINIWPSYVYEPSSFNIGPNYVINSIGTANTNSYSGGTTTDPANTFDGSISKPFSISGINDVVFSIYNDLAVIGNGINPGISEYDVLVDRKVVQTKRTDAAVDAPQVEGTYSLDTTSLCNGIHEVSVQAFDPSNTPGVPDYFQADITQNGAYNPIFINTNNNNQSSCSTTPLTEINNNTFPKTLLTTPQSIITSTTTPIATTAPITTTSVIKKGDLNGDSVVDIRDLSIILTHAGTVPSQGSFIFDLNNDNLIDIRDISILLTLLGK